MPSTSSLMSGKQLSFVPFSKVCTCFLQMLLKKYVPSVIGWTHGWEIHRCGRIIVSQQISLLFTKFFIFVYLLIYLCVCSHTHTHTYSVQCVCRDQKITFRIQFSSTLCGFSGLNLEYQGVAEDDFEHLILTPPLPES